MKCSTFLLEKIQNAIESVDYGKVIISLNEKGSFIDIISEKHERVGKEIISQFHNG